MNTQISKVAKIALGMGVLAVFVYLVLHINAQHLLSDDYSFLTDEYHIEPNLIDQLLLITFNIQIPQVRFVFIPHLLFTPFFRFSDGGQLAANIFFIGMLMVFAASGWILAHILEHKAVIERSLRKALSTKGLFYWLSFSALLVNFHVWLLLDFKITGYQVVGMFFLLCLLHYLFSSKLATWRQRLLLLGAFILALHATDLNLLVLPLCLLVVLLRTINWKPKLLLLISLAAYPAAYYLLNKILFPRPSFIFGNADIKHLTKAFLWADLRAFLNVNGGLVAVTLTVIVVGLAYFIYSQTRNAWGKRFSWEGITRSVLEAQALLLSLFFLAYSFFASYIAYVAYGGAINPHHYSLSYLCLVLSFVCGGAYLLNSAVNRKLKTLVGGVLAISTVVLLIGNLPNFRTYTTQREVELELIAQLEGHVEAQRENYGAHNYIVLKNWLPLSVPSVGDRYVSSAFYQVIWAEESFAELFLDAEGKYFHVFDRRTLDYTWIDMRKHEMNLDEKSYLIEVEYLPESNTLTFTDTQCGEQCTVEMLEVVNDLQTREDY